MKYWIIVLLFIQQLTFNLKAIEKPIDRRAVVERHKIVTTSTNIHSPAQVGNGEFAFGVDITGLQTFVPFNTMSQWSWHSHPLPEGLKESDYKPLPIISSGREVLYEIPNPDQQELSTWLERNPHRFNLGRVGLKLLLKNGHQATEKDIRNAIQEVDLWTGIITSSFELEGIPVKVKTACHPDCDMIGVEIESDLVKENRLSVFFDFPYPDTKPNSEYVGTYDESQRHQTILQKLDQQSTCLLRKLDSFDYCVSIQWKSKAKFFPNEQISPHWYELRPSDKKFYFTCLFSKKSKEKIPSEDVFTVSKEEWEKFWLSGAAIDLSGSTDSRWRELERRIVLSQYVMRMNEAGSLPPQESGLVNNGWYGKFHFEMFWWHGVHYALWNRWELLEKFLHVYKDFLPTSKKRAQKQGYRGARWPKCTADIDREWPHMIHATLVWQQPHPIYFAELDYQSHPSIQTLEKWKEIVFETADFMADFAYYDKSKNCYVLNPPLFIVSENTDPMQSKNPTFELGYWRFGLRVAQQWRKRLSLPENEKWKDVEKKLASLPVEDSCYVTYEGIPDMWTKYAFEHPALIGVLGMLPGDGVDERIFSNTLSRVSKSWNFNHVWGWDFPMLAMAAARNGKADLAVDYLLHSSPNFQFDEHGLATGGPFPYFPSNGALLTAVAMMVEGWGGSIGSFPGFPKNGSWKIKAEGFEPLL